MYLCFLSYALCIYIPICLWFDRNRSSSLNDGSYKKKSQKRKKKFHLLSPQSTDLTFCLALRHTDHNLVMYVSLLHTTFSFNCSLWMYIFWPKVIKTAEHGRNELIFVHLRKIYTLYHNRQNTTRLFLSLFLSFSLFLLLLSSGAECVYHI